MNMILHEFVFFINMVSKNLIQWPKKKKIWFKLWHDSKTLGQTHPWVVPLGVTSQNPKKGGPNLIQLKNNNRFDHFKIIDLHHVRFVFPTYVHTMKKN